MNETPERPRTADEEQFRIQIERVLPFPRERVWDAWTDPAAMSAWFESRHTDPPGKTKAQADVRVGGSFRLDVEHDGKVYVHSGVYIEVKPPERLVFSWILHVGEPGPPNVVTVSLHEHDGGASTRLVLTHEKIDRASEAADYEAGWTELAAQLEEHLAAAG